MREKKKMRKREKRMRKTVTNPLLQTLFYHYLLLRIHLDRQFQTNSSTCLRGECVVTMRKKAEVGVEVEVEGVLRCREKL